MRVGKIPLYSPVKPPSLLKMRRPVLRMPLYFSSPTWKASLALMAYRRDSCDSLMTA